MSVATRSIGDAFVTIAGRDGARDDAPTRAAAAIDGQPPRWVLRPASLDQLSRVVALAHDEGLAVIPRGGGTALELGHPPARVDVVVDLSGLDRVVEYNPDDLTVTVPPIAIHARRSSSFAAFARSSSSGTRSS